MLRKLGIQSGETRIFAWGTAALFLLGWVDVSVKNVAEVFFLKRVGVELMPLAFLVSSLLLVATTWVVGRIAAERDRTRLLPIVFIALAVGLLPLWLLVRGGVESAFGLLLIASKQITSIALLVFWIAMGDVLHSRQTKRLFAPMMAGMTVGTILGSFASKPLGQSLGIAGLLPVSALMMVLGALATAQLRGARPRFERARATAASATPDDARGDVTLAALWRDHDLFRLLLITTLCSGLLGPMLYFQFQYVADLATTGQGGEQRLLALYAQLRGWIYGAVLLMQLVGTGRLYRRVGLPLAAVVSPLAYLAGFVGLSLRFSLPTGVAAMAGTKIQDEAVYDPAQRVLCSLFPEEIRAPATALIEGPAKRGGGAVGNAAIVVALAIGSAVWVGYLALPLTMLWLLASLVLWRRYPRLLLNAAALRSTRPDALENELLDAATVRALLPSVGSEDAGQAQLALELIGSADAGLAVSALAEAAAGASATTRHSILAALERRIEEMGSARLESQAAARHLADLYERRAELGELERERLVRCYARLERADAAVDLLTRACADASSTVRLAAVAALVRLSRPPPESASLDSTLASGLRAADPLMRRTARQELRALLLLGTADDVWHRRLGILADAFADGIDRADTAKALADVAAVHGAVVSDASKRVLAARDDTEPHVRAALLRFAGYAGQHDQLAWIIDHLASDEPVLAHSARESVRALGTTTSNALVRELSYGGRSKREAIVEIMRELDLRPTELRTLYTLELDTIEHDLVSVLALKDRAALALLHQRLTERVHEALRTAMLFLAAIRDEDRIAELGERLVQLKMEPRQRAIVLEALDALLTPGDRQRLLPLLEHVELDAVARSVAHGRAPSVDETLQRLVDDPELLTRTIATGLAIAVARREEDHEAVNAVEKMALLKKVSLFEELTARELMELARVVQESKLPPDTFVVRQGEYDDRLYVVVEGVVHVRRGDSLLTELGPGSFFGEIALLEGVARSADAVTRTHTRLLGLERAELMKLIDEHPGIALGLLRTLSRRVRELTDRVIA